MLDLTGTPQHIMAKMVIADRLTKELEMSYNNILSFKDVIDPLITNLRDIASNFRTTPQELINTNILDFLQNINRYIPNMNPSGSDNDEDKTFFDNLKEILTVNYGSFHENSEIMNLLNITELSDLQNMTGLGKNFINAVSDTMLSGSLGAAFLDYDMDEMNVGSLLAVTQHNLYGVYDVTNNLANIVDISENLITNFAEVADLEYIQNLVTSLPSTMGSLFLDKLGNLNIGGLLDMVGLGAVMDIYDTITGVVDAMQSLVGLVTGGFADLLGGIGSCACALLLSVNSIGGALRSVGNFARQLGNFVGRLNTTIQNVTGIIQTLNPENIIADIQGSLDQIKDPEIEWDQIISTLAT